MNNSGKAERFPVFFPGSKEINWMPYKSGSYNDIFTCILDEQKWVLKKPKVSADTINNKMNSPQRFQRKNVLINPGFNSQLSNGFSVSLGRPVSDEHILPFELYIHLISEEQIGSTYRNEQNDITTVILNMILNKESCSRVRHKVERSIPLTLEEENKILDHLTLPRTNIIMPFIGDDYPSDNEIAKKVLAIYIATRNIIADACIPGNMLRFEGEIICVDLDCALHRDSEISMMYTDDPQNIADYEIFWHNYLRFNLNPESVEMVQTLFYLESNLGTAEITDTCLTPELIQKYNVLRKKKIPISLANIQALDAIITHYPEHKDNEALISLSLLSAVQLDHVDLPGHIYALFIEAIDLDVINSLPKIVPVFSLFQFQAEKVQDSDPEPAKTIRTI